MGMFDPPSASSQGPSTESPASGKDNSGQENNPLGATGSLDQFNQNILLTVQHINEIETTLVPRFS